VAVCASCGQDNPAEARFCMACAAPLDKVELRREVRKTVTVLFCDVAGSTALGERLDPESLRRVMALYFQTARATLERHGGTVEKFIGDAVMAVFGVPVVHEDDALRAVRAAAELRSALATLNGELGRDFGVTLEARIGVNTGRVVTGTAERLATGDAVNVAARLEQAAIPGEVLLGLDTYALVRDAVDAEPAGPLPAKGKEEPLGAYRLIAVREGAPGYARRLDAPLVGRLDELAQLRSAVERAERERTCYLFTLLGPAGIGKSRLVAELAGSLGERAKPVTGRCLSYGQGMAFWPLVEIARRLGGEDGAELEHALSSPAAAREEMFWTVRRRLEGLAAERPLVVVLDDFQWAEPMLLDLVEHVADLSREAPIALVCIARPELLELRPGWGGGKLNATAILLAPLDEADSRRLVDELLDGVAVAAETRERIVAAAEGNPLFIEQMVAFLGENGGGSQGVAMPPTIHALLSARLDRLADDERATLERASVVGKEFGVDALAALSRPGTELRRSLEALVRKELVRPHGEEAFRFRSLLIRDAAYEALPKQLRSAVAVVLGPTPLEECIPLCEDNRRSARGNRLAECYVGEVLSLAYGLAGRFEQARDILAEVRPLLADMGAKPHLGGTSMFVAWVELEAGDPAAAERELREGIRIFEEIGETARLSTATAMLAQALNDQGRYADALEQTEASESAAAPGDLASQIGWRAQRARALAHTGEVARAERLAREACDLARGIDTFDFAALALLALAEVLDLADRREEAEPLVAEAVELCERKGAAPAARRARMLLASLT
jgi:class 3 adenylate cyclase/tetratricopeptide (TPR) repeat protein